MRTALQPPERMTAHELREVIRRAEELAEESFYDADKDAQAWLYDQWSAQAPDVVRLFYATLTGNIGDARTPVLDRYVAEREASYRDAAKQAIEASYVTD